MLLIDMPGSFPRLHSIPHLHPDLGPRCQTSDPTDLPIIPCHISTDHLTVMEFGLHIVLPFLSPDLLSKVEEGGPEVQGHSWLQNEFEVTQDYVRSHL